MRRILSIVLVCICLSACAVSRVAMTNANYGPRPSKTEAMQIIKQSLERVLIDPDSLRLACADDIRKGWARDNMYDPPNFGWLINCSVNSKNSFGGYTGNKNYYFSVNGSSAYPLDVTNPTNINLRMSYVE